LHNIFSILILLSQKGGVTESVASPLNVTFPLVGGGVEAKPPYLDIKPLYIIYFRYHNNMLYISYISENMFEPSVPSALLSEFGNQTVVDKVLPDMKYMIHEHWLRFPPMNPLWHGLLGFVIGVLGLISISGNGMVLYIFSTTKSLRSPSNMLVMNLAFSDFTMMLCMSPAMVINCYYETWVFGMICMKQYFEH
jgi:hypothetical protein